MANKIVAFIPGILAIPFQIVTTFVLGLAVSLTFGLLLIPISLVWMVLLGPMLGLSYIWLEGDRLGGFSGNAIRFVVGLIGIPIAVLGSVYVALMPSMGEYESRRRKLEMCWIWPYTWQHFHEATFGPNEAVLRRMLEGASSAAAFQAVTDLKSGQLPTQNLRQLAIELDLDLRESASVLSERRWRQSFEYSEALNRMAS